MVELSQQGLEVVVVEANPQTSGSSRNLRLPTLTLALDWNNLEESANLQYNRLKDPVAITRDTLLSQLVTFASDCMKRTFGQCTTQSQCSRI
jgi:hypothetical protein